MSAVNHRKTGKISDTQTKLKDKLVLSTLKYACTEGFTKESLIKGAMDVCVSEKTACVLFPNPKIDLPVQWACLLDTETRKVAETLEKSLSISDKISTLIKRRIDSLTPYKNCVKQSFPTFILPHNCPRAHAMLWDTADTMWLTIGDVAKPCMVQYYTKRNTLSLILLATLGFWLQDDQNGTHAFIDNRIRDVLLLQKHQAYKSVKDFITGLPFVNHPLRMRG